MFIPGKRYIRKELHNKYGGNRQGGIASCSNHPYIFIFTGKSGKQHGYKDEWHENTFYYTGEGQKGDMEFKRGNKALLNHSKNKKKIILFESDGTGYAEYICELSYNSFDFFETPDTTGVNRTAIKFQFIRVENTPIKGAIEKTQINNSNKPNKTERKGLVTSRVGQSWYRIKLLEKWDNKCAVTGIRSKAILIASHIVPWKDSNEDERLDPENGILLSPNLDALFDKHLISFKNSGDIILSKTLSLEQYKKIGINDKMKLSYVSPGMEPYLNRHREKFNQKTISLKIIDNDSKKN